MDLSTIFASLFITITGFSCLGTQNTNEMTNKNVDIIREYADKTTRPEDVKEMKKILNATIDDWIEEYSGMGFYKEEDYEISDIMLFGKDKDKVLLFVHALLKDSEDGEVKLITAELKDDDEWHFRNGGLPNFYYEYREDLREGKKFTTDELLNRTFSQLSEDGLITDYNEISQDYIKNKWF